MPDTAEPQVRPRKDPRTGQPPPALKVRRYQSAICWPHRTATTVPAARYGPNGIVLLRDASDRECDEAPDAAEDDRRTRRDADVAEPDRSEHQADHEPQLDVTHPHPSGHDRQQEETAAVQRHALQRSHDVRPPVEDPGQTTPPTANTTNAG